MRKKILEQEYLDFSNKATLKVVREYRAKYDGIGLALEGNPKILDIAHEDFSKFLSRDDKRSIERICEEGEEDHGGEASYRYDGI